MSRTLVTHVAGINNKGVIAFDRREHDGKGGYLFANGKSTLIQGLSSPRSQTNVMDLNDSGTVAGGIWNVTGNQSWGAIWSGGKTRFFNSPAGNKISYFQAINDSGLAVGQMRTATVSNDAVANLWDGQTLIDLNTRLMNGKGISLDMASDINDAGQILAEGTINGQFTTFLLTPLKTGPAATQRMAASLSAAVPEPSGFFAGLAGLWIAGRRFRGSQN